MPNTSTTATLNFPAELETEIFNTVKGHSSLAKLSGGRPIPFSGMQEFVFALDGEAEIVGEGAAKSPGSAATTPVTVRPVKFVYQHRVTDEFMRMSEEAKIPILQAFSDGFGRKIARGLDIAAFHGINPRTGEASVVVGGNHFDAKVTAKTTIAGAITDAELEEAFALLAADGVTVSGVAMAPALAAALGKVKVNGVPQYPEFRMGGRPASLAGNALDINDTVSVALSSANTDLAVLGDFAGAFRWGYAANLPLEIIEYGDPDGLGDLKRNNQIVLRSEAYIGWGILDPNSFAIVDISA